MKIAITGGAGFIGSQLGKSLVGDGHDVLLIDDMSYGYPDNLITDGVAFSQFKQMDVRSPKLAGLLTGVDYVFHMAGISSLPACQENPQLATDVNVAGTANVLESSRRAGVQRVIFASTGAVYENNTSFPSKESDPVRPTLMYPVTKLQAEHLCRSYSEVYSMPIVITRYFNVYGPHQDYMRTSPPLISYIIRELLAERSPVLHSDGMQERDCVYVDDVNALNKLCMLHPSAPGQTFNVGSGITTSVSCTFELLRDALSSCVAATYHEAENYWDAYPALHDGKYPLAQAAVVSEVRKFTLSDVALAYDLLGWRPEVTIEEGLRRTAAYAGNREAMR